MLVGHDIPVCPRSDLVILYAGLRPIALIILLLGLIQQVPSAPSIPAASLYPMKPAACAVWVIGVIPTFGTYSGRTTTRPGSKPVCADYFTQSGDTDDLDHSVGARLGGRRLS